jgi:hypothetical protein
VSAGDSFASILARAPQLCEHTVAPPALSAFPNMAGISEALTRLCRLDNADAATQAAIGNVLVRQGLYLDALAAYRSAADLDPTFASAHLAAGELAHIMRDEPTSDAYRASALAQRRVYADPMPVGDRLPILLVLRDAPYAVNTPLELLIDRSRFAVHKFYVNGALDASLPAFACAIAAFGFARDGAAEAAHGFMERTTQPFLNDPSYIALQARETLPQTLDGIPGVRVVATERVASAELTNAAATRLVRPADSQAGDGLALVDSTETLDAHVARFPAEAYHVTPFVEYRSVDGYYRKYRIIFVDGVAYPYHLAISPRWMVHYQSSPMREYEWMRAEEEAFLRTPAIAIPQWDAAMPQIARALGLDYFGIDATVLGDGTLLVFESDSGLLVHDEDPSDVWEFKRPFVARIREALHAMIEGRANRRTQVQAT